MSKLKIFPEECMKNGIHNKFELVLLAACRAKMINDGASTKFDVHEDKMTVIAMQEIANSCVSIDELRKSMSRSVSMNDPSSGVGDYFGHQYVNIDQIPEDNVSDASRELNSVQGYDINFD